MIARQLLSSLKIFGVARRNFHKTRTLFLDPAKVEEVKIPVPWGHVAGRWWGDKNIQPIVALHGYQDNAATFDTLAPLLDLPSLLCLDLPGHGQSSHISTGLSLHYLDFILHLRYLFSHHFKWDENLQIVGHSFGASLGAVYAALFPNVVVRFVSIESAAYDLCQDPSLTPMHLRKSVDAQLAAETRKIDPITPEEYVAETVEVRSRNFPLSEKAARIIANRSMTVLPDGKVIPSGDFRLATRLLGRLTPDFLVELSGRLTCDVLNIRAEGGIPRGDLLPLAERCLAATRASAASFQDVFVPGGHHVHLEQPEVVAPLINEFFSDT